MRSSTPPKESPTNCTQPHGRAERSSTPQKTLPKHGAQPCKTATRSSRVPSQQQKTDVKQRYGRSPRFAKSHCDTLDRNVSIGEPGKIRECLKDPARPLLILESKVPPTGLVVIFHGAGDTAYGFQDLAEMWAEELPHVKFLLPTAPARGTMTAWFGKNKITGQLQNYEHISFEILNLIEAERVQHEIPINRVAFLGLSAGALMASWTLMNMPCRCAGLILLSGGIPSRDRLPEPKMVSGVENTPVLYCVGSDDVQFTPTFVRTCVDRLQSFGFNVEFQEFLDMGHTISRDEALQVGRFLQQIFSDEPISSCEVSAITLQDDIAFLKGGQKTCYGYRR